VIDLAHSVPGAWDTVVVLNPYASPAEIDAALGFRWRDDAQRIIEGSDRYNLLVFERKGRVTSAERLERSAGDFCCVERNGRYARNRARFVVAFDASWMRLRPVADTAG
jgi:hypothetical protein